MQTFVDKMMSLLFKMLSSFVTVFLPRSKSFNFMTTVTIHSNFGVRKIKSVKLKMTESKKQAFKLKMSQQDERLQYENKEESSIIEGTETH